MDNWMNLFIYELISMSINIYSVFKTSRSCDVICLNGLLKIWNHILAKNSLCSVHSFHFLPCKSICFQN